MHQKIEIDWVQKIYKKQSETSELPFAHPDVKFCLVNGAFVVDINPNDVSNVYGVDVN